VSLLPRYISPTHPDNLVLHSDAFTKREAALENQYIHQKEMEKYAFRAPSDVMDSKADTGLGRMKAQSDKLAAQGKSAQGEKK
jgi:hypothetical protein